MRRLFALLVLVVTACAAQPPERSPLPDVAEVLPPPMGCQLSVGEALGVEISTVIEEGAAAGVLEVGDIITAVDGLPTPTRPDLAEVMDSYAPGDTVELTFTREGKAEQARIELGASPDNPENALIGVTVQTSFTRIRLDEADDVVAPSPTARPLAVGGKIYIFDPLARTWQPTGVSPPSDTRWVSTSTGLYSVTSSEPVQILDLMTGETVGDDGFQEWDLLRLIGSLGDTLIVVLSVDVPDQPGFINLAVAGFNPDTNTTEWVSPVSPDFGVPVAAYGAADDSAFVGVGANQQSQQQQAVVLFSATGAPQDTDELNALGQPIGWFDERSMAFASETTVSVFDFIEGTTEVHEIPQNLGGSALATVGDGANLLVVRGRSMVMQNLLDPVASAPLASNCAIGQTGDPGWGL